MANLNLADFYYGAALSLIVNKKIKPALIDSGTKRRKYEFSTKGRDFILITRYRCEKDGKKDDYMSWTFPNIDNEFYELLDYLDKEKIIYLALILVREDLKKSEVALLDTEDIRKLIDKKSITISRKKGDRKYRISKEGGRSNAYLVPCDRSIEEEISMFS